MMRSPTFADVMAASARIAPYIHRTPVFTCSRVDDRAGAMVFSKAENLQKVGAFKARGALNAVLSLGDDQRAAGIATHSSGNHAQAVAYAASIVGADATIVMPHHAPSVKVEAVRSLGATIEFCEQTHREAALEEVVARTGATVVHPFDDPLVVAGQGTAAVELLEQVRDLDVIVTPIGGGGLLSGTTLVAAEVGIEAIGAEPEIVDDSYRSLLTGVRQPATGALSVGDGLLTGIGEIAFEILMAHRTEIIRVSEDEILEATRFVVTRSKQLIEPSSGSAYAALFKESSLFTGKRVGVIVSGGNVELSRLA